MSEPSDCADLGHPTHPARSAQRLLMALLVAAYTFNFVDRTIISIVGEAIKRDLLLSDAQLGLLGGIFFALFYTFLGLPIARISERVSRVNVISVSIAVWSLFTALCGAAHIFLTLALFRLGVGVGEAGLTPPGHALIVDYFPPRRRASALAIYGLGVPAGTMLGALGGGWVTQHFSWRVAFVFAGLPGLILAIAFKLLIREPVRGAPAIGGFSLRKEFGEIWAVFMALAGKPAVRQVVIGNLLVSFALAAGAIFLPTFLIRVYHYNFASVGLLIALVAGVGLGAGTLLGGILADQVSRRRADGLALVPALGSLAGAVAYIAAFHQTAGAAAVLLLMTGSLLTSSHISATFALVYENVPATSRATAAALYLFLSNIFAVGLAPFVTGALMDHIAAATFRGLTGGLGGGYAVSCPGGVAAAGASSQLGLQCATALSHGSRWGLTVIYIAVVWGALHFLRSATLLRRNGRMARAGL